MPPLEDPESASRYKSTLVAFMSYRDGQNYGKDHEFTQQELGAITPEELTRWMCLKVYGIEELGPNNNPREELQNQVKNAYQNVPGRQLAVNENPVKTVLLVVTGDEDEVHIDELGGGDDDGDGGDATGRRTQHQIKRDEIWALQSLMVEL